jgi:cell division septation protein DedD
VQLGSFGDDANAKKLAQRVNTVGYRPAVSPHKSSGGRVLYRVRVGPYEKRSEADATASSLSAHGFVAQVVAAD